VKRVKGDQGPSKKIQTEENNRRPVITREDTDLRRHCKLSGLRMTLVFVRYESAASGDRGLSARRASLSFDYHQQGQNGGYLSVTRLISVCRSLLVFICAGDRCNFRPIASGETHFFSCSRCAICHGPPVVTCYVTRFDCH
jgi:hypothetical protein